MVVEFLHHPATELDLPDNRRRCQEQHVKRLLSELSLGKTWTLAWGARPKERKYRQVDLR